MVEVEGIEFRFGLRTEVRGPSIIGYCELNLAVNEPVRPLPGYI